MEPTIILADSTTTAHLEHGAIILL